METIEHLRVRLKEKIKEKETELQGITTMIQDDIDTLKLQLRSLEYMESEKDNE